MKRKFLSLLYKIYAMGNPFLCEQNESYIIILEIFYQKENSWKFVDAHAMYVHQGYKLVWSKKFSQVTLGETCFVHP